MGCGPLLVATDGSDASGAAFRVARSLVALGVRRTVLLSGDRGSNVETVAREVGITEAHRDLLPEDEVRLVRALAATAAASPPKRWLSTPHHPLPVVARNFKHQST